VSREVRSSAGAAALTVGALGVVFGDIGTSPLYAFRETFHGHHLEVSDANVIGACSLVFWSLIVVVSLKYLAYVLRADNRGEGGILALTSLVAPQHTRAFVGRIKWLVLLGLFGTALLYGDGVITPAISVLSAVEGLEVVEPRLHDFVIPIAVGILVALFFVQRRGTGAVGKVFGPVMLVWFSTLGVLGVWRMTGNLSVLEAINPGNAIGYLFGNGVDGFLSLGSIFLAVTGAEALYADMGHFGKRPIRQGWFALVLPALILNYFGQGALLMEHPEAIDNPFFLMGPGWARPVLVAMATAATIIASQALISGVFSLTVQAVQLDYLPRVAVIHTSATHAGQVYVPIINWLLMIGAISLVLSFGSSSALAAAYGIAVTGTMAVTTVLMGAFVHKRWNWPLGRVLAVSVPLLVVDLGFFGANVAKIPDGGWFPIVVAVVIITMMTTWRTGRRLIAERIRRGEVPIQDFIADLDDMDVTRVPGTAVFLFKGSGAAPPALLTNTLHNRAVHERVLLLSVVTSDAATVSPAERVQIEEYGKGFYQVQLSYGFTEDPDVAAALAEMDDPRVRFDAERLTYFLGRETVIATTLPGMSNWRERLFALQLRTAASAARFFRLPTDRVVEVGSQVEI
jgi:KUP system potassium uptake protein